MSMQSPEFTSADALMAHYAAMKKRTQNAWGREWGKLPPPPPDASRCLPTPAPRPAFVARFTEPPARLVSGRRVYARPLRIHRNGSVFTRVLSGLDAGPKPVRASAADVMRFVLSRALRAGVTKDDILGPSRIERIMRWRMRLCWSLRAATSLSYPHIGQIVGGRDHTTALNSVRRFDCFIQGGRADAIAAKVDLEGKFPKVFS